MLKTIDSLGDLAGKKVLVRSDLNVPLDGTTITDDGRVRASVPTIQKLLDAGASVIVTAHLGRPAGAPEAKYSLAPAAARLSELLGKPVTLADDLVGESAAATVAALLAPGGLFAFSVEKLGQGEDYALQPSRRYAHAEAYVRRVLGAAGLAVLSVQEHGIRQDRRQPVAGLIVVATSLG